jgi:hypothetical protein
MLPILKKLIFLIVISFSFSQNYTLSDPYYLLNIELMQFSGKEQFQATSMRPFYRKNNKLLSVSFNNEYYINNNAPNQENMDVRYIGYGMGNFTSLSLTAYTKFLAFNFEPYTLINNYKNGKTYGRPNPYTYLNDTKKVEGLKDIGLRKADLFIHYNGFGFGWSNDNMWWGPGIQSSLAMTNNTVGFKNFMIGTINELKWKNIGLMGRYTFSELNDKSDWEAIYYTALTGQITYYGPQVFTFGFSRNYLSGGVDVGVPWTKSDAQKIVFEGVFIKNLQKLDYTIAGHDPWDQTITTWIEISFLKERLKIYLEVGFNDNRFNLWDFIVHPDHSMATIIGFRKYGLFNNDNIVFGFEYANIIKGRHHIFRATPDWYDRPHYSDFSYEGRRWGAHSGSDSDDIQIYFGLMNDKWAFIPSVNFERHGVSTYRPPEIKSEFKLDTRYKINNYEFSLIYENQFEAHIGFPPDLYFIDEITGKRRTNTLIFKLSKLLY